MAKSGKDKDGKYIIGNLRDQTIEEIWLGEKLTRYKKIHQAGEFSKIPICEHCDW